LRKGAGMAPPPANPGHALCREERIAWSGVAARRLGEVGVLPPRPRLANQRGCSRRSLRRRTDKRAGRGLQHLVDSRREMRCAFSAAMN